MSQRCVRQGLVSEQRHAITLKDVGRLGCKLAEQAQCPGRAELSGKRSALTPNEGSVWDAEPRRRRFV
jgi:hypothetical protein